MFTSTVTTDYAIERWTTEDGTEYAVTYDEYAMNPVEDGWCGVGMCFVPRDDRRITSGDESLRRTYEAWEEEKDHLEYNLDVLRAEGDEKGVNEFQEYLAEHATERPSVDKLELGDFTVYYDPEEIHEHYGTPMDRIEGVVKGDLDVYKTWCEGEVHIVGVTYPDGTEEIVGGIYLEHSVFSEQGHKEIEGII